jgi:hypothetical protein
VPRFRFCPDVASILAVPELVKAIAVVLLPTFSVPDREFRVRSELPPEATVRPAVAVRLVLEPSETVPEAACRVSPPLLEETVPEAPPKVKLVEVMVSELKVLEVLMLPFKLIPPVPPWIVVNEVPVVEPTVLL